MKNYCLFTLAVIMLLITPNIKASDRISVAEMRQKAIDALLEVDRVKFRAQAANDDAPLLRDQATKLRDAGKPFDIDDPDSWDVKYARLLLAELVATGSIDFVDELYVSNLLDFVEDELDAGVAELSDVEQKYARAKVLYYQGIRAFAIAEGGLDALGYPDLVLEAMINQSDGILDDVPAIPNIDMSALYSWYCQAFSSFRQSTLLCEQIIASDNRARAHLAEAERGLDEAWSILIGYWWFGFPLPMPAPDAGMGVPDDAMFFDDEFAF